MVSATTFFIFVHVLQGDFGFEMLLNRMAAPIGPDGSIGDAGGAVAASQLSQLKQFVANVALMAWGTLAPVFYQGPIETPRSEPRTRGTLSAGRIDAWRGLSMLWRLRWSLAKAGTALAGLSVATYGMALVGLYDWSSLEPQCLGDLRSVISR